MTLESGKLKSSSPRASRFYENMCKRVKPQKKRFTAFFDDKKTALDASQNHFAFSLTLHRVKTIFFKAKFVSINFIGRFHTEDRLSV